jgi:hypothetical protein
MRRINGTTTVLAMLAAAVTAVPQPAAAALGAGAPPPTGRATAWSVTLITGDRVELTERSDGGSPRPSSAPPGASTSRSSPAGAATT